MACHAALVCMHYYYAVKREGRKRVTAFNINTTTEKRPGCWYRQHFPSSVVDVRIRVAGLS